MAAKSQIMLITHFELISLFSAKAFIFSFFWNIWAAVSHHSSIMKIAHSLLACFFFAVQARSVPFVCYLFFIVMNRCMARRAKSLNIFFSVIAPNSIYMMNSKLFASATQFAKTFKKKFSSTIGICASCYEFFSEFHFFELSQKNLRGQGCL